MSEIRHFPGTRSRVETGPTQFGDDWPGVFIRGDNAITMGLLIERIATETPEIDPFEAHTLLGFARVLMSCKVRKGGA